MQWTSEVSYPYGQKLGNFRLVGLSAILFGKFNRKVVHFVSKPQARCLSIVSANPEPQFQQRTQLVEQMRIYPNPQRDGEILRPLLSIEILVLHLTNRYSARLSCQSGTGRGRWRKGQTQIGRQRFSLTKRNDAQSEKPADKALKNIVHSPITAAGEDCFTIFSNRFSSLSGGVSGA